MTGPSPGTTPARIARWAIVPFWAALLLSLCLMLWMREITVWWVEFRQHVEPFLAASNDALGITHPYPVQMLITAERTAVFAIVVLWMLALLALPFVKILRTWVAYAVFIVILIFVQLVETWAFLRAAVQATANATGLLGG